MKNTTHIHGTHVSVEEPSTASNADMCHPLEVPAIAWMAPEISMEHQHPAEYIFDDQVQLTLSQIRANEAREKAAKAAA